MRIRLDHLLTRAAGLGLGVGFLALGGFALLGDGGLAEGGSGGRALGLGVTLLIVGVIAIVGSLGVTDPSRIW